MKKLIPLLMLLFALNYVSLSQNVGISNNIFTPQSYLHVHQPLATGNLLQLTNLTSGNASNVVGLVFSVNSNEWTLSNRQAGMLSFHTNSTERLRLPNAAQIQAAMDGTAAMPAWSFVNGTNMGMYRIGANILGFSTNSSERMRIDANGNVGINGAPHASALLHINANNRGILIPNVALTATTAAGPVATPQTSLLVYNTATASAGATAVTPGFYYNAGTTAAPNWRRLMAGGSGADGWLTTGNYGTTPANNWIGTNDAQDFAFKTGGVAAANERMRITSAGNVLVNSTVAFSANNAFQSVASPALPYAIAAYGNGGRPVYVQQQSANGIGVWAENVAAAGAGNAATIIALSNQTGWTTLMANVRSANLIGNSAISSINATTTGTTIGIFASVESGAGTAVEAENNAAIGANGGDGVFAFTQQSNGFALFAVNGHTSGTGVVGAGNNQIGNYLTAGSGGAFTGTSTGVYARANTVASGTGVIGVGNNNAIISTLTDGSGGAFTGTNAGSYNRATVSDGTGVIGIGSGTAIINIANEGSGGAFTGYHGVYSSAINTSGTGVMAGGNNVAPNGLTTGSGGAFTGTAVGSYNMATTAASGIGVIGVGNNFGTIHTLTEGCGGNFLGTRTGVFGQAHTSPPNIVGEVSAGGYFNYLPTNAFAYVGARYRDAAGWFDIKILGPGVVSTIVDKPDDNTKVVMFAPEAPEILFQDYGNGQLLNGRATVELDPTFSYNIHVDDKHPLRVFIQLEGDCNGVYVTNKTATGFEVVELQGGTSNVEFSWTVTANRADRKDDQGNVVSKHQGVRFPLAPGPMETEELQLMQSGNKQIESTNQETSSKSRRKREVKSIDRDIIEVNPINKK